MPLSTLLWLGLLVALAILFLVTLRRMSALIARTRGLERFQRAVEGMERRLSEAAGPLVAGLDDTRRRAGDPVALRERLGVAQTVLAELRAECGTLAAPTALTAMVSGLSGELDRAIRAAALVEHGLDAGANASLGRDLEAQVSLKRGALNLRHAHESFTARAREVAAIRPADLVPGATVQSAVAVPLATYATSDREDVEGHSDPRM